MRSALFILTFACALGAGLVAGVFFAFSSFVIKALAMLPPEQGLAAMKAINVAAISPAFMALLFGTALACVAVAVCSFIDADVPGRVYLLGGSFAYLSGTILVTILFNVPRNDALAEIVSGSADLALQWDRYVAEWTAWNHVRCGAAAVSAMLFMQALRS